MKIKKVLFLIAIIISTSYSTASLSEYNTNKIDFLNKLLGSYKKVGEGKFEWFWIDIYDMSLYTPSGEYYENVWPLILKVKYLKNFSKKELLDATNEEWSRQNISYKKKWIDQLRLLWKNVYKGDEITLFVDDDGISHFFLNQIYLGSVSDKDFTQAFVQIWLSENTLDPSLREQVIKGRL